MSIPNIKTDKWPTDLTIDNWRRLVKEYFIVLNGSSWFRRIFPVRDVQVTEPSGIMTMSSYRLRQDGDFNLDLMLGEYSVKERAEKVLDELGWRDSFDWIERQIKYENKSPL